MEKITYFNELPKEIFLRLMFACKEVFYEEGSYIQILNDPIDKILILMNGEL